METKTKLFNFERQRIGIILVLLTALISGVANFFNKFAMQILAKDAFQYTALKNIVVALGLSLILLSPLVLGKLKKIQKTDWLKLIIIGLIGGGIPFLLFFKGLSLTSAVSASFIHKTLFAWVAILAWPVLKEKIGKWQFLALGLLLIGNFVFLDFRNLRWGVAETMILIATIMWAMETIVVKATLAKVEPIVAAWARMFFGSIFLFGWLIMTNNVTGLGQLDLDQLSWLVGVGVLLLGYVITWYSGLKRLSALTTASILVLASPITTLLNSIFVSHSFSVQNFWSSLIIAFGVSGFIALGFKQNSKSSYQILENSKS
ncbi:MAG: DMT family transporter [Patescibacteria group bacterium]|jgi:drug/metabolite transporter (DMT)-like permease|nr:DMT family transporter [Patescibacteria group bacterium]